MDSVVRVRTASIFREAIRQDGVQPIDLLPFQGLPSGRDVFLQWNTGFPYRIQLFLAVCHMYHCQNTEHHSLIPGGRSSSISLVSLFSAAPCHRELRQKSYYLHSGVSASSSRCLPPSSRFWISPHRFICRHRDDVNGQHKVPAKAQVPISRLLHSWRNLPKKDSAILLTQLEMIVVEFHRVRADPVFEAVPFFRKGFHVKWKLCRNICLEKVPEDLEPLLCIQLFPGWRTAWPDG